MNPVSSDDEHCHQQANNLKYIIVYINRPMNEMSGMMFQLRTEFDFLQETPSSHDSMDLLKMNLLLIFIF